MSDRNEYRRPTQLVTGPQDEQPGAAGAASGAQEAARPRPAAATGSAAGHPSAAAAGRPPTPAAGTSADAVWPPPVYRDVTGRPIPLAAGWERPDGERPRENVHQQWAGAAQADDDSGSLFAADARQSETEYRPPVSYPSTAGGGAFFTGARQAARDQEAARSGPVQAVGSGPIAHTGPRTGPHTGPQNDPSAPAQPAARPTPRHTPQPPAAEPAAPRSASRTGEQSWSNFQDYEPRPGSADERDHDERGYNEPGYDEPEYDEPGYDEPGYDERGYDEPGYGEPDEPNRTNGRGAPDRYTQRSGAQRYPEPEAADRYPDRDDHQARERYDDEYDADDRGDDADDRYAESDADRYDDRAEAPGWQQVHGSQPLSRRPGSGSSTPGSWPQPGQEPDGRGPSWGPQIPQEAGQPRFGSNSGSRWDAPNGPVRPWDPVPGGPGAHPPVPLSGRPPIARHSRRPGRGSGRGGFIMLFVVVLFCALLAGVWYADRSGLIDTDSWPLIGKVTSGAPAWPVSDEAEEPVGGVFAG